MEHKSFETLIWNPIFEILIWNPNFKIPKHETLNPKPTLI
jgi:hypothetical protein